VAHHVLAILRRRLLDFLTILSLLLCLATVALWVRSHWRRDLVMHSSDRPRERKIWGAESTSGELTVYGTHVSLPNDWSPGHGWDYQTGDATATGAVRGYLERSGGTWRFAGFSYLFLTANPFIHGLSVPDWFIVLFFAILPALRLRPMLHARRVNRAGLCPHCGYDLRATPERCPECGHVVRALAGG
jgi:hypothetical protein